MIQRRGTQGSSPAKDENFLRLHFLTIVNGYSYLRKYNIGYILVAQMNYFSISIHGGLDSVQPPSIWKGVPHSRQIHQPHSRVDSRIAVERKLEFFKG